MSLKIWYLIEDEIRENFPEFEVFVQLDTRCHYAFFCLLQDSLLEKSYTFQFQLKENNRMIHWARHKKRK